MFKNKINFVFITAPNSVPIGEQNPDSDNSYGWWFSQTDPIDYFHSAQESNVSKGFDHTFKLIETTFEEQGPFDGILGFSQGSSLAAILCCLKFFNDFNFDFKFVVLIAGFKSLTAKHMELYERLGGQGLDTPSLHIIGETDQVIAKYKSESLSELFLDKTIVYHSGGHNVPSNSSIKNQCNQFFDRFIQYLK